MMEPHLEIVAKLIAGLHKLHGAASLPHLAQMATLMICQFVPVRLHFQALAGRRVELVADALEDRALNQTEHDVVELLRPHLESLAKACLPAEPAPRDPLRLKAFGLTGRQAEVLHWIAEGKTSKEIGVILGCNFRTVDNHVTAILDKLGVETRLAAAAEVRRFDERQC